MIKFSDIANPPVPEYKPICVVCEGRGVVPDNGKVINCHACNGTGKQQNEAE